MRSAGNFHPEWGYLAPTPSFVRTLRIALVATAIGATAGAGVVVSLVARPTSGGTADSSIAAHALVTNVAGAATQVAAQPARATAQAAALPPPAAAASPQQAASGESGAAGTNTANATPAPQVIGAANAAAGAAPAHVAHVEEPAAAPAHEDTALGPEAAPNKKTVSKKHRGYDAIRRWQVARDAKKPRHADHGFGPLFRLFSSRTGSLFSAN